VVEDDRSCTLIATSEPVHISATQTSITQCGSNRKPWQLEAPAGQRISLRVLDFVPQSTSTDGGWDSRCRGRVYGFLVDKVQKTNVSLCYTGSAGNTRENGSSALDSSSNSAELLVIMQDQPSNNFLIRVEG